jgi:glycosyltransferase involved in cell wall biosynthesis
MSSFHKIIGTWKKMIDTYIVLTEFARYKFIQSSLKLPQERVVVKPNFVNDCSSTNSKRENYYIYLGRLTEEKGIKCILDSVKIYNYRLKIIGDGPLRDWVIKQSIQNPNIEYVGFQNKEYIINELQKSRGLIFPSIWYEGLPLSIIEALSTGTPIIISDIVPFKEFITHNYNGFHFETNNSKDLAEKIKYLDINIANMRHIYLNARKTYLEKYTPEGNYHALMEVYQNTIYNYGKKKDH